MIRKELVDVVNSGDAVSILGSGLSVDAGLPDWRGLFEEVAESLDAEGKDTRSALSQAEKGRLPEAFERLARLTSKEDVHSRVASRIEQVCKSSALHRTIGDWPFRVFITTNYDHLLEDVSAGIVPVGNRGAELHKLSGGARDIVWHVHGGTRIPAGRSQLVLMKSDYDEFYPSSNLVTSLRSIATSHRCVFVGFGFKDADLLHVLRAVGRVSHSGRPSFAFIGYTSGSDRAAKEHQDELRSEFNVEVVPYLVRGRDHGDLHRVLEGYIPFIVRRSISLARVIRECISC